MNPWTKELRQKQAWKGNMNEHQWRWFRVKEERVVQGEAAEMASPDQAGVAALLGRLNSVLTKWAVMEVLSRETTASDFGLPSYSYCKTFRPIYPGFTVVPSDFSQTYFSFFPNQRRALLLCHPKLLQINTFKVLT